MLIIRGSIEMKESFFKFRRPLIKDIHYELSDNYTPDKETRIGSKLTTSFAKDNEMPRAIVKLHIDLGSSESENSPFSLSLTSYAEFHWDSDSSEEKINKLLQQNAPALLLSYARPVISTITANSGLQYDMPFIDFTSNRNSKQK